jgi:hypothetical protein
MTQPPSLPPDLPESTSQRLNSYALAAVAAGVGILASASPANAKIVYTPSNIPIDVNGALVNLDLNHDGINDFQFAAGYSGPGFRRGGVIAPEGNHESSLGVTPLQRSNRVWAVESQGHLCAAAAPKGEAVGPHRRFQPGNSLLLMAFASGDSTLGAAFCPWIKTNRHMWALSFLSRGRFISVGHALRGLPVLPVSPPVLPVTPTRRFPTNLSSPARPKGRTRSTLQEEVRFLSGRFENRLVSACLR